MTKADIVNQIAKTTGVDKNQVAIIIEEYMKAVKKSLVSGESVFLRGFGTFLVKHRAEKAARNISKNTTVIIPAHSVPAFKASKEFIALIRDRD